MYFRQPVIRLRMERSAPDGQSEVLHEYAAGRLGTRDAIERAGLEDYADLLVAMVHHDLDLPLASVSAMHDEHLAALELVRTYPFGDGERALLLSDDRDVERLSVVDPQRLVLLGTWDSSGSWR